MIKKKKGAKVPVPFAPQAAAKKLLEYDLLTRNEGSYSIADPLMALWLRSKRF
ncbi:MAG: hypothetical protein IKM77_02575 [Prevotella sp.]|nr:hypothetical protein [Prevotella sp.]